MGERKCSVLDIERLVLGPQALGISFEFWEHLVLRLLKEPNAHFPCIREAFLRNEGGVSFDIITKCLTFYSTLIVIYFTEEVKFRRECYEIGYSFNRYLRTREENDAFVSQRGLPFVKHTRPQIVCTDNWELLYCFEEAVDDPTVTYPRIYRYHEPTKFKKRHTYGHESRLSLEVCQGISSRAYPTHLDVAEHLHYIDEYSRACEDCKEEADRVVRRYANLGYLQLHRPRFHPAFYPYVKVENDTVDARDAVFCDGLTKLREEEGLPPIDLGSRARDRPTRKFMILSLILDHILQPKVEIQEVVEEYFPTEVDITGPYETPSPEEPYEVRSPPRSSPTDWLDPSDQGFVPVTFQGKKRKNFREYCRRVNPRRSLRIQAKNVRRSLRLMETK